MPGLSRRRFATWLVVACGAGGLGGCLSPTLPLPPPEPDQLTHSGAGDAWDVRGTCTPGAVVLIQNLETGVLAGTDDTASGRYFIQIAGTACDPAAVFQILGFQTEDEQVSAATHFSLVDTVGGIADFDDCQ